MVMQVEHDSRPDTMASFHEKEHQVRKRAVSHLLSAFKQHERNDLGAIALNDLVATMVEFGDDAGVARIVVNAIDQNKDGAVDHSEKNVFFKRLILDRCAMLMGSWLRDVLEEANPPLAMAGWVAEIEPRTCSRETRYKMMNGIRYRHATTAWWSSARRRGWLPCV